jgi:hypothetical protein
MLISTSARRAHSRLAQATAERNKRPNDPGLATEVDDRRREYRYLTAEDYIRQLLDSAPPLTPQQRDKLALLLRNPSGDGHR